MQNKGQEVSRESLVIVLHKGTLAVSHITNADFVRVLFLHKSLACGGQEDRQVGLTSIQLLLLITD